MSFVRIIGILRGQFGDLTQAKLGSNPEKVGFLHPTTGTSMHNQEYEWCSPVRTNSDMYYWKNTSRNVLFDTTRLQCRI